MPNNGNLKTLGILGGMSWHSSAYYYQTINSEFSERHHENANPRIILDSLCFNNVLDLFKSNDAGQFLAKRAATLEQSGVNAIVIASNTVHACYDEIKESVSIPILHLADGVAEEARARQIDHIALLGTRYTMTGDFYTKRLKDHGLKVTIPEQEDIKTVDQVITGELIHGVVKAESRKAYERIIKKLALKGAGITVLGCTELGLLIKEDTLPTALLDTAKGIRKL